MPYRRCGVSCPAAGTWYVPIPSTRSIIASLWYSHSCMVLPLSYKRAAMMLPLWYSHAAMARLTVATLVLTERLWAPFFIHIEYCVAPRPSSSLRGSVSLPSVLALVAIRS
eukprot:3637753-Rhodomonas_salina.1